nr:S26 family signal peptidase [Terracoccus luteus]
MTVPDGKLWVMGDNRAESADSRYHRDEPGGGFVPESDVVGRAIVIVWPPPRDQPAHLPRHVRHRRATVGRPPGRRLRIAPRAAALTVAGGPPQPTRRRPHMPHLEALCPDKGAV